MKLIFIYIIGLIIFLLLINAIIFLIRLIFGIDIDYNIDAIGFIIFNVIYLIYRFFYYKKR